MIVIRAQEWRKNDVLKPSFLQTLVSRTKTALPTGTVQRQRRALNGAREPSPWRRA